jgi:V-type H+-transporting ATPase subunit E
VKQEQQSIDAQYEKKLKGAEVAQKMYVWPLSRITLPPRPSQTLGDADTRPSSAQSTLTNKSRLKLLHKREEHVQDLFATAREELVKLSEGRPHSYCWRVRSDGHFGQTLVAINNFLKESSYRVTSNCLNRTSR